MTATEEFIWPDGKRSAVSLSFDDARVSQIDRGMTIFESSGIRASFYVSPHNMDQRRTEWRRAAADGNEIGNHTVSHPCSANFPWSKDNALENYTLARMEKEIARANAMIRDATGVNTRTFAYPCGQTYVGRGDALESYIPLVAGIFLAARAYQAEISNDPKVCDLANLGAFESDGRSFEQMWKLIDDASESGRWTILCGHEIGGDGVQVTSARALETLCQRLRERSRDIWTAPIADIADWIKDSRTV